MSAIPSGQRAAWVECNRKPLGVSALADVRDACPSLLVVRPGRSFGQARTDGEPAEYTHRENVDGQKQEEG